MSEIYNWTPISGAKRGPKSPHNGVRISTRMEHKKKAHRSCFAISAAVMAKMRWVCGDRVEFMRDEHKGLVCITRVPHGGYTLSGRSKADLGKSKAADVGITGGLPKLTDCHLASFYEDGGSLIVEWK
jgi:hypothetical protein